MPTTINPSDQTITQYNVQIGGASNLLANVAPSATSGIPVISQGASAAPVFGTVVVAGGGSGLATLTAHALYVGNGTSAPTALAVGTTGQALVATTGADPAFGTLPVAGGGTGLTTLTAHALYVGNGTSTPIALAVGTTGQVLTGNTGADPAWAAPATSGTVTSVSGTANQVAVANGTTTPVISLIGPYTPATYTTHGVLIGEGTSSITALTAGNAGQVLQSGGASADPVYTTSTYPATATGTGKILIADGTNWVASTPTYPNAASTALKHIKSDGTNFVTTTVTYPDASVTSGKVIISDGTNYIASTPTFPNTSASSGKFIRSDGTNWIASTPTLPTSAGTSGKILQSDGTNYVESTPTYPSTSGSAGKILRSDGTNNLYTTSTYPDTNAVSTLLYASSANVMAALATANGGVLSTSSSGVPSIDTTNFSVLSTGLQLKGNNTNTTPPAGFIGQTIGSYVGPGSPVSVSTNTGKTITSISLTAGIWDVSGIIALSGILTGTVFYASISATNNALGGNYGDDTINTPTMPTAGSANYLTIPSLRVLLSSTTTYYLVIFATFTVGTATSWGRISATRVG